MTVEDRHQPRGRTPASAVWAAIALWLVTLCALPSESRGVRPSDHGLAFQGNATRVPPAMEAFFRGDGSGSGGMALPEARNTTGAIWDVAGRAAPGDGGGAAEATLDGRDRVWTVLLTTGVVCGAVGVALLAAAAFAYLIQARRRGTGVPG